MMTQILSKIDDEVFDRFWSKVNILDDEHCWDWVAGKNQKGYGEFKIDGSMYRANRVSWIICNSNEIPDGMIICHKCDNPSCVNPNHLFLGTHSENMVDMTKKDSAAKGMYNGANTHPENRPSPAGEINGRSKLKETDVEKILIMYHEDNKSQFEISENFGVSESTISLIVNGKTWKNIYDFFMGNTP
jgi:predicted XRE-type DNA-binding protein